MTSDEELAKMAQEGQNEAFGELIERYEPKLLRYGRRFLYAYEDVEDAVQDTFIKTYTNIKSFNPGMRFSPWIYRIAHNTFINVIKKRGREPVTFFEPDTFIGSLKAPENQEEEYILAEDREKIETLVENLPPKYREPIILYFYEEKDYKEIADIMQIPTSTVGIRIKRAKDKLKKLHGE